MITCFQGQALNVVHVSNTYLIKTLLDKHLFVIGYRNITSNQLLHIGTHLDIRLSSIFNIYSSKASKASKVKQQ